MVDNVNAINLVYGLNMADSKARVRPSGAVGARAKKKSYHHGDLQQALIDVGLREARSSGSKNLGLNYLAKKVNVSPPAVYRHFANGESLRARISQQAREELARRMLTALEGKDDVRLRFEAVGRAYIQFSRDEPGLFAVAFGESDEALTRPDDPSAWMILQDCILDLCSAGYVNPSDASSVATFAWSIVHGYATLLAGDDPVRPDYSVAAVDELIARAWAGITQRFR